MIDLPSGLDEVVAYGWPWHGRIRRDVNVAQPVVELPNGRTFNCDYGGSFTYLYDAGKADIQSDAIEALGGAWWGKAILRDFNPQGTLLTWGGGLRDRLNDGNANLFGIPLVMPGYETPWFVRLTLDGLTLAVAMRIGTAEHAVSIPVTLDSLGQGAGQPSFYALQAASSTNPQFYLVNDAFPGSRRLDLLDFRQNKMLFGVVVRSSIAAPSYNSVYERTPGTVNDGWPTFYAGLVEIEIGPDAVANPAQAITIRTLEDRATALGSPLREQRDEPNGIIRDYLDRWTQVRGLVTAWYDGEAVRTARFDRMQECTLRRWIETNGAQAIEYQTRTRVTELRLVSGNTVVDELRLAEILEEIQSGPQLQVVRTVQVSSQQDDVTDSGPFTGTAAFGGPFTCFPPGLHGVNTVVAYIYSEGGGNRLREQDIRMIWLLPYSNQLGCLAYTQEPYDYPAGSDSMPVQIVLGPCLGPAGVIGSTWSVAETHYRGEIPDQQFYRGFFHTPLSMYMRGSYNPVTGQLARNERARLYSWV